MSEPTELPWSVSPVRTTEGTAMIVAGEGPAFGLVADVTEDRDAAFIVKAVNNHDAPVSLLAELYAQVRGECPSLLNEDSGGDGTLDLEIRTLLASVSPPSERGK